MYEKEEIPASFIIAVIFTAGLACGVGLVVLMQYLSEHIQWVG